MMSHLNVILKFSSKNHKLQLLNVFFQLLHVDHSCPEVVRLREAWLATDEVKQINHRAAEMYKFIGSKLGVKIETVLDAEKVYDTFKIHVSKCNKHLWKSSIDRVYIYIYKV